MKKNAKKTTGRSNGSGRTILGVESWNGQGWVWTACADEADQRAMLSRMRSRSVTGGYAPLECRPAARVI